jgi:hypothetical protein
MYTFIMNMLFLDKLLSVLREKNRLPLQTGNGRCAKDKYYCESIQGARLYNEDIVFACEDNKQCKVYGILDGHAGMYSVTLLKGLMCMTFNDRTRLDVGDGILSVENVRYTIEKFYEEAVNLLKDERSGVVSLVVVIFEKKVVMGWLGDCEACLFVNEKSRYGNSILGVDEVCLEEIDMARKKIGLDFIQCMPTLARNKPHTLGTSVVPSCFAQWKHSSDNGFNPEQETYSQLTFTDPDFFRDVDAQTEYDLVKTYNMKRGMNSSFLDITRVKIGDVIRIVDTRFTNSIQPTRSVGDNLDDDSNILRFPCILNIELNHPLSDSLCCILCTDGFFHNGAFEDISKLSDFFVSPLDFFCDHFYHEKQELTVRLMACGLLPSVFGSESTHELFNRWKQSNSSWEKMMEYIVTDHMNAIESSTFLQTYSNSSQITYSEWILSCRNSCIWIKDNICKTQFDFSNLTFRVSLACHLSVLMGSLDNISIIYSLL